MFRQLSMSAEALYQHHTERIAMQVIAEREAAERASRCGRPCDDLAGFEHVLEARLQEAIG
jgi:hypothetical protein